MFLKVNESFNGLKWKRKKTCSFIQRLMGLSALLTLICLNGQTVMDDFLRRRRRRRHRSLKRNRWQVRIPLFQFQSSYVVFSPPDLNPNSFLLILPNLDKSGVRIFMPQHTCIMWRGFED